jgi:transcriptional regulator NrdR family protein
LYKRKYPTKIYQKGRSIKFYSCKESIILTGIIEAKEKRDVMTTDIPNAFVQASTGLTKDGEKIIMKIRGALVDMLVEIDSHTYKEHVSFYYATKILYVHV